MLSKMFDTLLLVWPILLAIVIIILMFLPTKTLGLLGAPRISILDFVIFERFIPIAFYRIVFFVIALILILLPSFRDYSSFFPRKFKMDVFYDDLGVAETIESLSESERRSLRLAEDWSKRKLAYFSQINSELAASEVPFQFSTKYGITSSIGETTFEVKMVDLGIQTYQIDEAQGSLRHSTIMDDNTVRTIFSEFQLLSTASRFVRVRLEDIYSFHSAIIRPEFRQVFRVSPAKELFHHSLTVATRVYLLPPDIGRSLYLIRSDDGLSFPIGYAVYSF